MLKPLWNSLSRTCRGRKRGQEYPATSLPGMAWWKAASASYLLPVKKLSLQGVPVGLTQEGQKQPGPRAP